MILECLDFTKIPSPLMDGFQPDTLLNSTRRGKYINLVPNFIHKLIGYGQVGESNSAISRELAALNR